MARDELVLPGEPRDAGAAKAVAALSAGGASGVAERLLDLLPIPLAHMDSDFTFLFVNAAYAEEAQRAPEALLGHNHFELYPNERNQGLFEGVVASGAPHTDRGIALPDRNDPDGATAYWDWTLYPVPDDSGRTASVLLLLQDVTAQTRSEARQAGLSRGLRAVVGIAEELMACADDDSVCRSAVELCRERLGVERCAIFVSDGDTMRGTYGTDDEGRTTDEHAAHYPIADDWTEQLTSPAESPPQWIMRETDHSFWRDGRRVDYGVGWVVHTPIQSVGSVPVGLFINDAALSGAPVNEELQQAVVVLCTVLATIIEQKRVEAALARREAELQAIFANAAAGIAVAEPGGRLVSANEHFARVFGYGSLAELLTRSVSDLTLEEDRATTRAALAAVLSGDSPLVRHERRYVRADGSVFWGDVSIAPARNLDGTVGYVVAVLTDVTARKQAEEALRQSEERYRDFVEGTGDLIVQVDADGRLTYANHAAAWVYGLRPEEAIGMLSLDFVHPDDRARSERWFRWLVGSKSTHGTIENRQVSRTGQVRRMLWSSSCHFDSEGEVSHVNGIARDISERGKAEEAVRQSEARYRGMFESSPISLWEEDLSLVRGLIEQWRRSGITDLRAHLTANPEAIAQCAACVRVVDVNQASLSLFGAETKAELMAGLGLVFAHESYDGFREGLLALAEGERLSESESVNRTLAGERLEIAIRWSVLPGCEEDWSRVLVSIVDITGIRQAASERLRLEGELQHAQRLESLSVLAGGVAHDFNNLLTGVLGNAELALDLLPPESPARALVHAMEASASRGADLARQMLAYSGRASFFTEPVQVTRLVRETLHLLEAAVARKTVVRAELTPDVPLAQADATQLTQVLMNLTINAAEAIGDEAGLVTIRTGSMGVDRDYLAQAYRMGYDLEPGRYVYLQVADTGCGMDAATRARIFEPFFSTKFAGRGLGLAASLGIVRGHRGGVRVDSAPGRGSTFTVILPVLEAPGVGSDAPSAPVSAALADAVEAPLTGTVLVVDDEPGVRFVATRALERAGFTVVTAEDGERAVELFGAHRDELVAVLLDLTMPHRSGDQVFDEIHPLRPELPVLLCSGFTQEEATRRFGGQQLAGFLQKPYRPSALVAKLRDVLAGGRMTNGHE